MPWSARYGEKILNILKGITRGKTADDESESFVVPFLLKTIDGLEILSEPPKENTGAGVFTIVEVRGNWGRLKSGAGWVDLNKAADNSIIIKAVFN